MSALWLNPLHLGTHFALQWPLLLLLLPAPWLLRHLLRARDAEQQAALYFPALDTLLASQENQQRLAQKQEAAPWWLWLIWLLLVLAAARPQWQGEPVSMPQSGRDLLLVVDLSPSMETPDMELNGNPATRMDATKVVVSDFVQRRKGDRVGLVLFGKQAYLQTPLTFDRQTLVQQLQEALPGFAGDQTAIGDAIALASKRLQDRNQKSRVIILLTDGANTGGALTPLQGADIAKTMGIKIYTVGVGADEITRRTFFGIQKVNPSSDLDEKTLTSIAEKTGGSYFRARNTQQLDDIYRMLDQLEPVEGEQETLRPVSEWFYWPLAIALLISLLVALRAAISIGDRHAA